ncbi:PAS domain S-box protein [Patescibacteria group bacterium]
MSKRAVNQNNTNNSPVNLSEKHSNNKQDLCVNRVLDYTPDPVLISDLHGIVVDCNKAALSMYGMKNKGNLIGSEAFKVVSVDKKEIVQGIKLILKEGPIRGQEVELKTNNGKKVVAEISVSAIYDKNQTPIGIVSVFRDISKRRKVEDQRKRYEFIVNTSKDFLSLIDEQYTIKAVNDMYCQALGRDRKDIIGKSLVSVWGKKKFEKDIKPTIDRCFSGHTVLYEGRFHFFTLGKRDFKVAYYPYQLGKKVTHAVVVSHDITKEKQLERALRSRQEDLRMYSENLETIVRDRTKALSSLVEKQKEFISHIGHELRTPLSVMKAIIETEREFAEKNIPKYLEVFDKKIDMMTGILKNIMLLTRLTISESRIHKQSVNMHMMISEIVRDIHNELLQKHIKPKIQITCDKDLEVKVDQSKLVEVIVNLIRNACVHAEKKPNIQVRVKKIDMLLRIVIDDSNKSISTNEIKKIFEKFYRTKKSRSKNIGSGLGLYISKQIIDLLNGKIWAERLVGEGNRFIVEIPVN